MNRGQLPYPSNHERNVRIVPLTAEEQKRKIDGGGRPTRLPDFPETRRHGLAGMGRLAQS